MPIKDLKSFGASAYAFIRSKKFRKILSTAAVVTFLFQILFSVILMITVNRTGMLPWRYVILLSALLIGLAAADFLLLSRRFRGRMAALVLSLVVMVASIWGAGTLRRTLNVLGNKEASYKTDDMVAVVLAEDTAENILDAGQYTFGIQNGMDESNTAAMRQDIEEKVGASIQVREYASPVEVAQALLDGEVGAIIYNQAYEPIIEEAIEGYADRVKVIHNYGIETEIVTETVEQGEPFNILISGIDVRGSINQTSRSDVNIIVTVNPNTKKILMTTTPRDYYLEIPGVSGGQRDKLTHAGLYGVDASMATLEKAYGIEITYYVRVNFTTLVDVVDAIGGVDVYIPQSFDAYTDSSVHLEAGQQHLNGRQALAFCRERYSFADGDNQRGKDQEAVLKAILQKMMSPGVLLNVGDLLDSLGDTFATSLPEDKIAELVNMQLSDNATWSFMRQEAGKGEFDMQPTYSGGSMQLSVTWPDEDSLKENASRIQAVLEDTL